MKKEGSEAEFEMPKRTFTAEFFVGLFAIAGLLCFAYLAVNLAGMKIFSTGYYEMMAEFDNISGLEMGARVEIAGVAVGEVVGIELKDTLALVEMRIKDSVKLRDDDIAMIRTKGIIGERYVKISPGASDELLKKDSRIFDTESVVDFEDIIGKLIHKME